MFHILTIVFVKWVDLLRKVAVKPRPQDQAVSFLHNRFTEGQRVQKGGLKSDPLCRVCV